MRNLRRRHCGALCWRRQDEGGSRPSGRERHHAGGHGRAVPRHPRYVAGSVDRAGGLLGRRSLGGHGHRARRFHRLRHSHFRHGARRLRRTREPARHRQVEDEEAREERCSRTRAFHSTRWYPKVAQRSRKPIYLHGPCPDPVEYSPVRALEQGERSPARRRRPRSPHRGRRASPAPDRCARLACAGEVRARAARRQRGGPHMSAQRARPSASRSRNVGSASNGRPCLRSR